MGVLKQLLRDLHSWWSAPDGPTVPEIVTSLLIVCLAFSALHFLSMVATRWGDRRISAKSVVFSALLHASCLLALLTINLDRSSGSPTSDRTVAVRKLVVENPERHGGGEPGQKEIVRDAARAAVERTLPLANLPARAPLIESTGAEPLVVPSRVQVAAASPNEMAGPSISRTSALAESPLPVRIDDTPAAQPLQRALATSLEEGPTAEAQYAPPAARGAEVRRTAGAMRSGPRGDDTDAPGRASFGKPAVSPASNPVSSSVDIRSRLAASGPGVSKNASGGLASVGIDPRGDAKRGLEPEGFGTGRSPLPTASFPLEPESGVLQGRVKDASTGKPVSDVVIRIDRAVGGPLATKTGRDGSYEIPLTDAPANLAVSVSRSGYLPASRNVKTGAPGSIQQLDFSIRPLDRNVIAVESEPKVHHIGNDKFEGRVNSQFQRKSEGEEVETTFTIAGEQLQPPPQRAEVTMLAKGVQAPPEIRINGTRLEYRFGESREDGTFGAFTVSLDPALLRTGSNRILIQSGDFNGDPDDFEFINVQIRLFR